LSWSIVKKLQAEVFECDITLSPFPNLLPKSEMKLFSNNDNFDALVMSGGQHFALKK
jgi:hypothetical protein